VPSTPGDESPTPGSRTKVWIIALTGILIVRIIPWPREGLRCRRGTSRRPIRDKDSGTRARPIVGRSSRARARPIMGRGNRTRARPRLGRSRRGRPRLEVAWGRRRRTLVRRRRDTTPGRGRGQRQVADLPPRQNGVGLRHGNAVLLCQNAADRVDCTQRVQHIRFAVTHRA